MVFRSTLLTIHTFLAVLKNTSSVVSLSSFDHELEQFPFCWQFTLGRFVSPSSIWWFAGLAFFRWGDRVGIGWRRFWQQRRCGLATSQCVRTYVAGERAMKRRLFATQPACWPLLDKGPSLVLSGWFAGGAAFLYHCKTWGIALSGRNDVVLVLLSYFCNQGSYWRHLTTRWWLWAKVWPGGHK